MATIQYIVSASEKKELVHIDTYSATKKDLQCLLESSMYLSDAVINAYIRILKAQPSIQARQDGDAYLETTYFSTMIRDDSTTKLRDQNEKKLSSSSYINLSPARYGLFPINIKNNHWYLAVVNGSRLLNRYLTQRVPAAVVLN
ncbi:hypothetical protein GQ55_6G279000 [Panicum hallii var. hallii]|uniref:Ubiquitin-like protease family profile domain-containing protein n=1 Tax=Panicum hallii var. hallii TaxID=1504633 RepID=A0A2T7DAB0_9POAL|nr:hypothetical protein GQ55_6G279000 [Panicum hallii var. hallii]